MAPAEPMIVVVGLGNPGRRYRRTRHNIGFRVVDELARRRGARLRRSSRWAARMARLDEAGRPVFLVEPQTYMNRSGLAVRAAISALGVVDELLVVLDDVYLSLGRLRVRRGGGDGGHNGLRSIIDEVGSSDFARLRVGVGTSSAGELSDHVLSRFERSERSLVRRIVAAAADAAATVIDEGVESAMNKFNGIDLATDGLHEALEESV